VKRGGLVYLWDIRSGRIVTELISIYLDVFLTFTRGNFCAIKIFFKLQFNKLISMNLVQISVGLIINKGLYNVKISIFVIKRIHPV